MFQVFVPYLNALHRWLHYPLFFFLFACWDVRFPQEQLLSALQGPEKIPLGFLQIPVSWNADLSSYWFFFFLSLYWICYNIASALCFVFWLQGVWDLGSLTRDRTYTPCVGRRCLNHWTAREIPWLVVEEKEDGRWSAYWKTQENERHYSGDGVRSPVTLSFSISLFSVAASVSPPLLLLLLRSQTSL